MISDTPKSIQDLHCRMLAEAGFERRLQLAISLSIVTRQLSMSGVASAHPEWGKPECRAYFCEINYGRQLAEGVRARLGITSR